MNQVPEQSWSDKTNRGLRDARRRFADRSLRHFADTYLRSHFFHPHSSMHLELLDVLGAGIARGGARVAAAIPLGYGASTLASFALPLWAACYSHARFANLTFRRVVEAHQRYLANRGQSPDQAENSILQFLKWDEPIEASFGSDTRIVLVAGNFGTELTTAVLWLNERDLDIRCVRLQPHNLDGRTLLNIDQVLPLREASEYQMRLRENLPPRPSIPEVPQPPPVPERPFPPMNPRPYSDPITRPRPIITK